MQLTYYNSTFKRRQFPITIICENVTNAANVGSLFRAADAFGVKKLIFCGRSIPMGRKMTYTSRATEKYVDYECFEDIDEVLKTYQASGHHIIALEITHESLPITKKKFEEFTPIVLLVGDERFGISESSLQRAHSIIHIDMFGSNSSMNVAQATSIALYEMTKQLG